MLKNSNVASLVPKALPCPFCGCAEPQFDSDLPGVTCDGCGATGPIVSEGHDPDEEVMSDKALETAGIGLWNQRCLNPSS